MVKVIPANVRQYIYSIWTSGLSSGSLSEIISRIWVATGGHPATKIPCFLCCAVQLPMQSVPRGTDWCPFPIAMVTFSCPGNELNTWFLCRFKSIKTVDWQALHDISSRMVIPGNCIDKFSGGGSKGEIKSCHISRFTCILEMSITPYPRSAPIRSVAHLLHSAPWASRQRHPLRRGQSLPQPDWVS